jgi:hypothetical protein
MVVNVETVVEHLDIGSVPEELLGIKNNIKGNERHKNDQIGLFDEKFKDVLEARKIIKQQPNSSPDNNLATSLRVTTEIANNLGAVISDYAIENKVLMDAIDVLISMLNDYDAYGITKQKVDTEISALQQVSKAFEDNVKANNNFLENIRKNYNEQLISNNKQTIELIQRATGIKPEEQNVQPTLEQILKRLDKVENKVVQSDEKGSNHSQEAGEKKGEGTPQEKIVTL